MSNKIPPEKLVYELIIEIIKLEELFTNGNYKEFKGYLVNKNIFDGTKKLIHYEDLKNSIEKENKFVKFEKVKIIIKTMIQSKKPKYVVPSEFKNSKQLIKDISISNSQYYIINDKIGDKVFKIENKAEYKKYEISFEINEEYMILSFLKLII